MKPEVKRSLKSFVVELAVYSAFVTAYFFLVLHFLGGWLRHIFDEDRRIYAATAVLLMICQGLFLDALTRLLLNWIHPNGEDK